MATKELECGNINMDFDFPDAAWQSLLCLSLSSLSVSLWLLLSLLMTSPLLVLSTQNEPTAATDEPRRRARVVLTMELESGTMGRAMGDGAGVVVVGTAKPTPPGRCGCC